MLDSKMFGRAASVFAKNPNSVRIIDHQAGVVAVLQRDETGQIRHVAFHREDAVDGDELAPVWGRSFEFALEIFQVVMLVLERLAKTQSCTV